MEMGVAVTVMWRVIRSEKGEMKLRKVSEKLDHLIIEPNEKSLTLLNEIDVKKILN